MKELILENQNLIYALTNYFKGYSNKEDLFQAGCIGMIQAYKKYDANKGAKFTTYATPYILGEMKKLIREDKNIKISSNINKLYLKIEKTNILLTQQLMRMPTYFEIASYLEIPEYLVAEALNSKIPISSLDVPINDNGKPITLEEIIGTTNDVDLLIDLRQALNELSKEEQELIMMRYINDQTQQEIAKILKTSQVQVHRKEQKILTKLKDKLVA